MFFLSKRFGALSDRIGPRIFMGGGPLVAAAGVALMMRIDQQADYLTTVLPAVIVFGLGLALTVAPLTATVLGSVDEQHAGIASAINNSIARVAGLLAIAAVGAVIAAQFSSQVDSESAARQLHPGGAGRAPRRQVGAADQRRAGRPAPTRAGAGDARRRLGIELPADDGPDGAADRLRRRALRDRHREPEAQGPRRALPRRPTRRRQRGCGASALPLDNIWSLV